MRAKCPEEFVTFAEGVSALAARIHRENYGVNAGLRRKQDGSLVTRVDVNVEAMVRERIADSFPSHGVVGEEFDDHQSAAEWVWIVDPLDMTVSYVTGLPNFTFLLALAQGDELVLGVADQAILRQCCIGANGHGTRVNGREVRPRNCRELKEAIVETAFTDDYASGFEGLFSRIRRRACNSIKGGGSYAFSLLAAGKLDLLISNEWCLHDYAPLGPIVQNAGGVALDWQARELDRTSDGSVLAASSMELAEQVLEMIRIQEMHDDRDRPYQT